MDRPLNRPTRGQISIRAATVMKILLLTTFWTLIASQGLVIIPISPRSEKIQCSYMYTQCLLTTRHTSDYQTCGQVLLACLKGWQNVKRKHSNRKPSTTQAKTPT